VQPEPDMENRCSHHGPWLTQCHQLVPWPKGSPPALTLRHVAGNHFELFRFSRTVACHTELAVLARLALGAPASQARAYRRYATGFTALPVIRALCGDYVASFAAVSVQTGTAARRRVRVVIVGIGREVAASVLAAD
jgi:hypothetical protein